MWVSFIRAGFALGILGFMMFVLTVVLSPILEFANSGPNADAESVVRISGWFDALTLDNLTLLAGLAVGLYLLYRAVIERRVSP